MRRVGSRVVERLFGVLVRLLPEPFRSDFGPAISETLAAGWARARRRGRWAGAWFMVVAVADLLGTASRERIRPSRGGRDGRRASTLPEAGTGGGGPGDELRQNLAYAVRKLARTPGFTFVAIATLGVAIGSTTSVYAVVRGVLLRPLDLPSPRTVVSFWPQRTQSPSSLEAYRDSLSSYAGLAGWAEWGLTLNEADGSAPVRGVRTTANYFRVLGAQAALGRTFAPDEDRPGRTSVVLLSHGLWMHRFGGDPEAVGRSLTIDGVPHRVIGVMPEDFRLPRAGIELWLPYEMSPERGDYDSAFMWVVGRLRPGVRVDQARRELAALLARIRAANPGYPQFGVDATVVPLRAAMVEDVRSGLWLLLGAVVLVLLLASTNLAVLHLGRALNRSSEAAVCLALGASRARLVRQMMSESLLLGALGGGAGVLAAWLGTDALIRVLPPDTPRLGEVGVDGGVLALAGLVTVSATLLFGLLPALRGARSGMGAILRTGRGDGIRSRRLGNGLVVAELTLAVVLLVTAGLLVRSFHRLQAVDPGVDPQGTLTAQLSPVRAKYQDRPDLSLQLYDRILTEVAALPGVESVGLIQVLPMAGTNRRGGLVLQDRPGLTGEDIPWAEFGVVGGEYFRSLGIPVREGRVFEASDDGEAPAVAVVSEELAERYWPGEDPVGKRLRIPGWRDDIWHTVVGVVGDVRHEGPAQEVVPQVYIPRRQYPREIFFHLLVRSAAGASMSASAIRERVWAVDPGVAVENLRPFREILAATVAQPRMLMRLLVVFAGAAAVLGCIGIYSVMVFRVRQRRREIAIRLAVGADRTDVRGGVVREALVLATVGIVLGLAAALAVQGVLAGLLFQIRPTDPWTMAYVVGGTWGLALLSSWIPAARASSVPPVEALR